jgi:ElaB/YqjD/DUF883 family membrane-anchored ribosome-binding protein
MAAQESVALVVQDRPETRALQRRMDAARERMLDRVHEVRRRIEHTRAKLDVAAMIRARPMVACGIAAGAGFIAGLLVGGRGAPRSRATGVGATLAGLLARRVGGLLATAAVAVARERLGTWLESTQRSDRTSARSLLVP